MSLFSIDLQCDPDIGGCAHEWVDYIDRKDRDRKDFQCPACNGNWGCRVFRSMNFMSTERHKSKAELDKEKPLVEAVKLEKEMMSMPVEKRTEIRKQIKELKKI